MSKLMILAWLSCGYAGWFMTIRSISAYRVPSVYDACMIVPSTIAGPIFLAVSVRLAYAYS